MSDLIQKLLSEPTSIALGFLFSLSLVFANSFLWSKVSANIHLPIDIHQSRSRMVLLYRLLLVSKILFILVSLYFLLAIVRLDGVNFSAGVLIGFIVGLSNLFLRRRRH